MSLPVADSKQAALGIGLAVRHWALAGIRGVLLRILGGGVLPGSPNPDPISDQEIAIFQTRFRTWPLTSIPVFRPGL